MYVALKIAPVGAEARCHFPRALTWSNLDAKSIAIYDIFKVARDTEGPRWPSSLGVIGHGGRLHIPRAC